MWIPVSCSIQTSLLAMGKLLSMSGRHDGSVAIAYLCVCVCVCVLQGVIWTPSKMITRLGKEIDDPDSVYYWAYKVGKTLHYTVHCINTGIDFQNGNIRRNYILHLSPFNLIPISHIPLLPSNDPLSHIHYQPHPSSQ